MGFFAGKATSASASLRGSMIVGWRVAGLRALEFVPFGAHIGSGCKEAPTCLY
jgi:hypothetical protein